MRPYFLALLAEAYGTMGQPEEGLHVLAEALALVDKTGERWYEPELHRLKGELLLLQRLRTTTLRRKPASTRPSTSPVASRRSRWSCAPP